MHARCSSSSAGTRRISASDGFVPCCVDREGADWLVEHDSHGELLALIADYYRFTRTTAVARGERGPASTGPWDASRACSESDGLLPVSVSHEGYLAQPVHSYWDDFWALRGLRDAADLARVARPRADAPRRDGRALAARLGRGDCSPRSRRPARARELDFIPGSVEWADFDPTATANAIYLLRRSGRPRSPAVERTFDNYLADWRAKRSRRGDRRPNYTPYEIRIIGALVRLGRRDAALELLRFFLVRPPPAALESMAGDRMARPQGARARGRSAAHLDFRRVRARRCAACSPTSARRERALVLAAGLAPEWIEGEGVACAVDADALRRARAIRCGGSMRGTLRFDIAAAIDCRAHPAAAARGAAARGARRRCGGRRSTATRSPCRRPRPRLLCIAY